MTLPSPGVPTANRQMHGYAFLYSPFWGGEITPVVPGSFFRFPAIVQIFSEKFFLCPGPLLDGRFQGGEGAQIVGDALEFDPHPVFSGFGIEVNAPGAAEIPGVRGYIPDPGNLGALPVTGILPGFPGGIAGRTGFAHAPVRIGQGVRCLVGHFPAVAEAFPQLPLPLPPGGILVGAFQHCQLSDLLPGEILLPLAAAADSGTPSKIASQNSLFRSAVTSAQPTAFAAFVRVRPGDDCQHPEFLTHQILCYSHVRSFSVSIWNVPPRMGWDKSSN